MGKYTSEKNTLILISLLKQYGIRKIIVSPGAMNVNFVGSIQSDDYFQIYSCVDERSACYLACGLAEESGEPVALSCTGATASRNYVSGLTEAYYRKLPIIAITSAQFRGNTYHNIPQIIDRTNPLNDIVRISVQIPMINNSNDEWLCNTELNKALLELNHHGGGPIHINLETAYGTDFSVKNLPETRKIDRFTYGQELPEIVSEKIGIFVGAHSKFSSELTESIDAFCEKYNCIVLCDRTSNYFGKYKIMANLITDQDNYNFVENSFDLIIHIGNISGAYMKVNPQKVWRINPDGNLTDTFKKLSTVFEMQEIDFFSYYIKSTPRQYQNMLYPIWKEELDSLSKKADDVEIPFSNIWIARELHKILPEKSTLHLGILNSLRSWNYFTEKKEVYGFSNTGGFGIDGITSTIIGASLASPHSNIYGVIGDLAFFYDINSLGNRSIKSNIRLLLINNGCGTEFHNYSHAAQALNDSVSDYVAADGHFGGQSRELVKQYVENLGFEYLSATNKSEFQKYKKYFASEKMYDKPIVFEVFTNSKDESNALKIIRTLKTDLKIKLKKDLKNSIKKMVGPSAKQKLKHIIAR